MPIITIQQTDGRAASVDIATDKPLLMALEATGSDAVPIGCRGGGCGICRIQVLSGQYERLKMSRTHVSELQETEGYSLACRTIVKGDLTIKLATPEVVQQRQTLTKDVNEMMKW